MSQPKKPCRTCRWYDRRHLYGPRTYGHCICHTTQGSAILLFLGPMHVHANQRGCKLHKKRHNA